MTTQNRILWLPNDAEDRHVDWDDLSPSSVRNPSGLRIDSDTSLRSTVVLACARVLAESVASLPLHLYQHLLGGGKEPAREHPLYRLLHTSPNSWQTSFEWREQQVLWICLWGNSYNLIVPGSSGFATELHPLHPSRMKVERIENGRLRYKYRQEDGREEVYTQDQIMAIRWLSDDGINGMIPVELARDAIGLARACEIHGARYFGNGARPGFVLTTDNDMKPEAAAMLRDNWERMHRGADRASRTAVLFGGLKPMELAGSNNQESQFLETRRFQIEEICRLYRVPPHLVGDLTRSSFSNIEQQSIDFVQHTLLPWLRRFENAFARDLIVEDDKFFAEFDTRGLLRGDAAARSSYYSSLYNLGVVSINEIRSWESMNPVEGGDLRFVQLNMQTLTQANAASEAVPQQGEEATAKEPEQPTADVSSIIAIVDQVGKGAITPEAAKAVFGSVFPQMPESIALSIIKGATKTPEQPPAAEPAPAEPTQPDAVPAGRSLWQGSLRDAEGRSLTISIDFDRTFAADPELMGDFATKAKADGNTVVMITRRADTPEDREFIEQTLGSYADSFDAVILAGPDTQKETAATQAGISVDIWIDDSPQTIKEIRGFCPTGPGGGVDNSCGKEGGGGGGGSISKGSVKAGMKVTITKSGAKTSTSGVVKSVSHEGKKSVITFENGKSVTIFDKATIQAEAAHAQATGDLPSTTVASPQPAAPPVNNSKHPSPEKNFEPPLKSDLEPANDKVQEKSTRTAVQEAIVQTATAKEAIKLYSKENYRQLNDSLRRNGEAGEGLKESAAAAGSKISAAMMGALDVATQIENSESRLSYRGIKAKDPDGGNLTEKFADMNVGSTFVDTAFGSTTRSPEKAADFSSDGGVVLRVTSTYGLPMEDLSFHSSEAEILMPRNLRYRVTRKKWQIGADGRRQLHIDVTSEDIATKWTKWGT